MVGWSGGERALVVLQSFAAPGPRANPYLSQLIESLPASTQVETFTWRRALFGRYDVFHCHWPEHLIRSKSFGRRWLARILFILLLVRLRMRRSAVVRTVHNVSPHELGDAFERGLLRRLDRGTSLWITLTDQTPLPSDVAVRVIPHGHYRDWYAGFSIPQAKPGRLLFFGLVRAYKGVDELVSSFERCPEPGSQLRIVGAGADPAMRQRIAVASSLDPRITAQLSHASDEQLATEIGEAGAVVLPYREMHNSGALLLTLSLGRRAVVPASDVADALSAEVGPGWITTFQHPCDEVVVARALDVSRLPLPTVPPNLAGRDWSLIGRLHAAAYRDAVRIAG